MTDQSKNELVVIPDIEKSKNRIEANELVVSLDKMTNTLPAASAIEFWKKQVIEQVCIEKGKYYLMVERLKKEQVELVEEYGKLLNDAKEKIIKLQTD